MSQKLINGQLVTLPSYPSTGNNANNDATLDATGETEFFVGYCCLQDPNGGNKTISAAGSGKIVWLTDAITFANAGTTFDVGIQDVSTTATPSQGDGTFDVKASFTGGGGGITGSALQTSTMTTGTKTIAHGDLIAIGFAMTVKAGADSVTVTQIIGNTGVHLPCVVNNTSGSYGQVSSRLPNGYIVFDDGSLGWIFGSSCTVTSPTITTFNSGTATADEYGNLISVPHTFTAYGIVVAVTPTSNTCDFELILYSDPLGTPVAERTITVDASALGSANYGRVNALFSSPFNMKANTPYGVTVRPTTANNLSIYSIDTNSEAGGGVIAVPNARAYAIRRLDNTGAFSDYNGGTAKTRFMHVYVAGSHMEQGVNNCFNQLGI